MRLFVRVLGYGKIVSRIALSLWIPAAHCLTRHSSPGNLEDPRPLQEQPSSVSTLVRPLFGPYPHGFAELAKKTKPAGARVSSIFALADETALLDQLLSRSSVLDDLSRAGSLADTLNPI